ncbi:hypothetical protein [Streptomyces sp. NPDC000410]|uniref:hypothetical protein n=1 Tax=Streptomyces sp. NPDC000410 TaxID=3154254 RepID=UPI00333464CC
MSGKVCEGNPIGAAAKSRRQAGAMVQTTATTMSTTAARATPWEQAREPAYRAPRPLAAGAVPLAEAAGLTPG